MKKLGIAVVAMLLAACTAVEPSPGDTAAPSAGGAT